MLPDAPLLTVELDGAPLCTISRDELPAEKTFSARLQPARSVVWFRQPDGSGHRHTLGFEEGWAHFSVRVHETLACQADCVISGASAIDRDEFASGQVQGIRFQPFFLADCADPAELAGRGLFSRGLHFAGQVSPGNLSLSCICDDCSRSFRLQSFHAGFGQVAYFYSASGRFTLTVPSSLEGAPASLSTPDPAALAQLEARLPPAPDGTRFGYLNGLRCPHCGHLYIDFAGDPAGRAGEYYGNTLFGERPIAFEPDVGP